MFLTENTSCNILKYRVGDRTDIDEFAMRILKEGEISGVFVPGVAKKDDGIDFLVPVSSSMLLEEYLYAEAKKAMGVNSLTKVAELMRQAIEIDKRCSGYMLGESVLIKNLKYTYVTDGRLQLICLPVAEARYESDNDRNFLRSILAAGSYSDDEWKIVGTLLNFINSEEFNSDEFLFRLEKLTEAEERANAKIDETDDLEIEIEVLSPKEELPTGRSLFRKLKKFLFPDVGMESSPERQTERIAPTGVHVLAVRSTGNEYPLCFGPDVIGTDENTCSICFPDSKVIDENHCKVYFDRNRFYIEDMYSGAGTFLNNEKLSAGKAKLLESGDLIRVGGEELVFSKRIPI